MIIEWDVPITMDDGFVLRADVFRPDDDRAAPGPDDPWALRQGAGVPGRLPGDVEPTWRPSTPTHWPAHRTSTRTGRPSTRRSGCPTATCASAWTPAAQAAHRATSTSSRHRRPRTIYECIEWAGAQPWSNGKVGLLGISYFAINQWQVAALQPPHLAAICPWEGAHRLLPRMHPPRRHPRTCSQPAGIRCRCLRSSTASGNRRGRNPVTGEPVAGPETPDRGGTGREPRRLGRPRAGRTR